MCEQVDLELHCLHLADVCEIMHQHMRTCSEAAWKSAVLLPVHEDQRPSTHRKRADGMSLSGLLGMGGESSASVWPRPTLALGRQRDLTCKRSGLPSCESSSTC